MGGEKFLVGLRGLKIFQSRFGSFFGSFFAFFKPFFVSILNFFGGSFVLHACRPNKYPPFFNYYVINSEQLLQCNCNVMLILIT